MKNPGFVFKISDITITFILKTNIGCLSKGIQYIKSDVMSGVSVLLTGVSKASDQILHDTLIQVLKNYSDFSSVASSPPSVSPPSAVSSPSSPSTASSPSSASVSSSIIIPFIATRDETTETTIER